jgi:tetratricopeptide (TPR) repeat protein
MAVLHGLWIHNLLSGRLSVAREHAEAMLHMAEEANNPSWTLIGYRALGALGFPLGELDAARSNLERGLALFSLDRRAEYAQILVDDPRVVMQMYLGWVLGYQGHQEEAFRAVDLGVQQARELGQLYNLAYALCGHIMVGLFVGDTEGQAAFIQELSVLAREQEIAYFAAVADVAHARYLVGIGDVEHGVEELAEALETYRATGSVLYLPTFLMWRADALALLGRFDEAMEVIASAKIVVAETGSANDWSEILRVEGELLRANGDVETARRTFENARAVAERQGANIFLPRILASQAALEAGEAHDLSYPRTRSAVSD